jgi:carbon monoxide dehydrogenase subunit G
MESGSLQVEHLKINNMAYNSKYISRTGKLSCTASEFFGFISDMRNLEQFIPGGIIMNWQATEDSCSFGVQSLGSVWMKIVEKIPFSEVSFSGNALERIDFNINVQIKPDENIQAEIIIILTADLNPLLKGMASGPIEKFLDTIISEMEKFGKWNVTFKDSRPL